MTSQEISEIMTSASKLDIEHMDMRDQIKFFSAMCQFAEQVKPLVVKYSDKLPKGSKFLFKM